LIKGGVNAYGILYHPTLDVQNSVIMKL
jgi:hypothetical protein